MPFSLAASLWLPLVGRVSAPASQSGCRRVRLEVRQAFELIKWPPSPSISSVIASWKATLRFMRPILGSAEIKSCD